MKKKEWKLYAQYLQSTVDELMQTVDDLRGALADEQESHGECQAGREALARRAVEVLMTVDDLRTALEEERTRREASVLRVEYLERVEDERVRWYNELLVENTNMQKQLDAISDIVNNGEK